MPALPCPRLLVRPNGLHGHRSADALGGILAPTGDHVSRTRSPVERPQQQEIRGQEPAARVSRRGGHDGAVPLTIGFDLDLTLIDTRPGFVAVLEVLSAELGLDLPAAELVDRLGPPLEQMLAPYVEAERLGAVGDRFRELYPDLAITSVPLLPGAREAVERVRADGGRVVVVTGKVPANARRHLDHLDLVVDHLEGWVWGVGKAQALRDQGAVAYVGDHVHDVEGALAAGVLSVSVLTGGSGRAELEDAGTHVVLPDLTAFPAWWGAWSAQERG